MDLPEESKKMLNWISAAGVRAKSNEQTLRKFYIVSDAVPLDILNGKDSTTFFKT